MAFIYQYYGLKLAAESEYKPQNILILVENNSKNARINVICAAISK